jgi:hypothetical protein
LGASKKGIFMNDKYLKMLSNLKDIDVAVKKYLEQNRSIILLFTLIILAAYGFELFNFNLTIDEEAHALYPSALLGWIEQGRWGMYTLNRALLPYTVIPFVPLFTALVFHLLATLLLFESWEISSQSQKLMVGAIGLTFPIIAYMYTFSTINYGIGVGIFCVSLSVFFYKTLNDKLRIAIATIPATFAIGIYEGFLPALASVYAACFILNCVRDQNFKKSEILSILAIHLFAIIGYIVMQRVTLTFISLDKSSYVAQFFSPRELISNFVPVISRVGSTMGTVYVGDPSIYATRISVLPVLLLLLFSGFAVHVASSSQSILSRTLIVLGGLSLFFIPFVGGLVMGGHIAMRFLVAMPVTMMGIATLGLKNRTPIYKAIVGLVAGVCIFQFIVSTNYLFGSSHLALQADRLLASRLVNDIDLATVGSDVDYLEIVGHYSRPSTPLIPKIETFGASFFEWDQGSSGRVIAFLQTIGYHGLQPAPLDKRIEVLKHVGSMPSWPNQGSVEIFNDVVLVKFGPHSDMQKREICNATSPENEIPKELENFCQ